MSMLKKFRLLNEYTQFELAKKLGISINAYANYEKGIRTMPLNITYRFLKLRGEVNDIKLCEVLEEIYPNIK